MGTIEGFVKGFIDLVFEWEGRFYLADYKTNHLGRKWGDYGRPALVQAMAQGHYFLQANLYTVALHRHLQRTVHNYRYDEHFGGVVYLFLRGMNTSRAGSGVYHQRPAASLIAALNEIFAGAEAA